jgi:hypothetical protein
VGGTVGDERLTCGVLPGPDLIELEEHAAKSDENRKIAMKQCVMRWLKE